MIAYEELEKALARWKARRSGASAVPEARAESVDEGIPSGVPVDETPPGDTGVNDSSGEMELGDASIIDES